MYIIFRDATGRREGIVLVADQNRMRVAVQGGRDATEMELKQGQWTLDGHEPAEIESLVLLGDLDGFGPLVAGIGGKVLGHSYKAVA